MNRRVMLAFGAVAVVAAAVILYFAVIADRDPIWTSASGEDPVVGSDRKTSRTGTRPTGDAVGSDAPREYYVDGRRVRDHRSGNPPPVTELHHDRPRDDRPRVSTNGGREISRAITADLNTKLQVVLAECMKDIPKAARGAKARLDGTVFAEIKGQQLRVVEATMKVDDVEGSAAAVTCMQEKSVGISAPATNEADVARYAITVSYGLRK